MHDRSSEQAAAGSLAHNSGEFVGPLMPRPPTRPGQRARAWWCVALGSPSWSFVSRLPVGNLVLTWFYRHQIAYWQLVIPAIIVAGPENDVCELQRRISSLPGLCRLICVLLGCASHFSAHIDFRNTRTSRTKPSSQGIEPIQTPRETRPQIPPLLPLPEAMRRMRPSR